MQADAEFLDTLTNEEASSMTDLHRSNLLRMQTDQLVETTALDLSLTEQHVQWAPVAHSYTNAIVSLIEDMPLNQEISVDSECPFALTSDSSLRLDQRLEVVPTGSFATGLGLTTPAGNAQVLPTLDMVVQLPNMLFEASKDYLRERYFQKRNRIVWHVAKHLSQNHLASTVGSVYWTYSQGDPRKPVLLLVPPIAERSKQKHSKKKKKKSKDSQSSIPQTKKLLFRLLLHFGMESTDWIPPLRLVPNRCNLNTTKTSQSYNHALTEDAAHSFDENHAARHHKEEYPHWNASVILAKVWCLQRGLLRDHDGWTTHQISLLILYLYRTKQANPRMASTQVLTAFFKLLAETDWLGENDDNKGNKQDEMSLLRKAPSEAYQDIEIHSHKRAVLVLPEHGQSVNQTIARSELAQLYARQTRESPLTPNDPPTLVELYEKQYHLGPVLLDPTMRHNYLGRLSPSFVRLVQSEARKSLECLHSASVDRPFGYLFMQDARFWKRYDAYLQIPLADVVFDDEAKLWSHSRHDLGDYECVARGMIDVLHKALGDRVRAVRFLTTGNGTVDRDGVTATQNSDQVPTHAMVTNSLKGAWQVQSPTGQDVLVLGIGLNPDTCFRVVDRGPPADDAAATRRFLNLWGSKAELRRFQDGAIVHALVWNTKPKEEDLQVDDPYICFQNDDKVQGGIVERIIRHILQRLFLRKAQRTDESPQFALRNMLSAVDTVLPNKSSNESAFFNPLAAQRKVMNTFETLSEFLRKQSLPTLPNPPSGEMQNRLGIPLTIDAVEPLSPSLRYAELFPPLPHPFLGSPVLLGSKRASGAVQTSPIEIQVRFGASSKWPSDLKAISAAKTAMLIQLVNGIETMKQQGIEDCDGFDGPMHVTPSYADVSFGGYVFRIFVRSDPELKLLHSLANPSPEAQSLLRTLTRRHVVAATHHSMVHAVYTRHASSSVVVRLAKRWVSSHLLSGLVPFEAVELLIVCVYSTESTSPLHTPASAVTGFLRFLDLLASHDWAREPLIVDPQGNLSEEDRALISKQFEKSRGASYGNGPPMYIVSPNDRMVDTGDDGPSHDEATKLWLPSFTERSPERVVLTRAAVLAQRSYDFLMDSLRTFEGSNWSAVFQEMTASFKSYSALLRVDPAFIADAHSSSTGDSLDPRVNKHNVLEAAYTRSMHSLFYGPKVLQRKLYRNLMDQEETKVLLEWRPIDAMVEALRKQLGHTALFFYNDLCPEVVAVLWRPVFTPRTFSVMVSRVRPVTPDDWKSDTLVTVNVPDLLREISQYTSDIVVGCKVFDTQPMEEPSKLKRKRKLAEPKTRASSSESDDSQDSAAESDSDW